ncbi:MAG: hypothetical protein HY301_04565 [Verrucomicrobia bacterium]|nr:hypothetical protein [Verrucomicrobiota bacterium]
MRTLLAILCVSAGVASAAELSPATNVTAKPELYFHQYDLSPESLAKLAGHPGEADHVSTNLRLMRLLFARNGVLLEPPNAAYYKDRIGLLLIRAPLVDLEKIKTLLGDSPPVLSVRPGPDAVRMESIVWSADGFSGSSNGLSTNRLFGRLFRSEKRGPGVTLDSAVMDTEYFNRKLMESYRQRAEEAIKGGSPLIPAFHQPVLEKR